jgi:hypothetical protein
VYLESQLVRKMASIEIYSSSDMGIEKREFGQVSESGKLPPGKFLCKECAPKSWLRTFLAPSAIRRWKDSFVVDHIYDGEAL